MSKFSVKKAPSRADILAAAPNGVDRNHIVLSGIPIDLDLPFDGSGYDGFGLYSDPGPSLPTAFIGVMVQGDLIEQVKRELTTAKWCTVTGRLVNIPEGTSIDAKVLTFIPE